MSNGRSIVGHAPKAASCGSKEASCMDPTDCNAEQLRHQACTPSGERQQWGRNAVSCWRLQGKHMLLLSGHQTFASDSQGIPDLLGGRLW